MEIKCVADVLEIVKSENGSLRNLWVGGRYAKFPHGIWFRGQQKAKWELTPSVFRKNSLDDPIYPESVIYHQFRLRQASYREVYKSTFEWLCLMQHYRLPTRLLDWTESILVALYFAVDDSEETRCKHGKLFALSASKLNKAVYLKANPNTDYVGVCPIYVSDNFEVVLRAEAATGMIDMPTLSKLALSRYEFGETEAKDFNDAMNENRQNFKEYLSYPIAVYPFRLNERMIFQASVFTIHGGKYYPNDDPAYSPDLSGFERIPEAKKLEDLNENQEDRHKFLKSFTIPQKYKERIKNELERIGIHKGTLFPELEYQASYIKQQWKYNNKTLCPTNIAGNL